MCSSPVNYSVMVDQELEDVKDLTEYLRRIIKLSHFPTVLELGSRQVTGDSLVDILEFKDGNYKYIGFDIIPGPNVDIVGDAHELSKHIPNDSIDLIISKSVFEHIAMPWKVVLEANKVLKQGGLIFINTFFIFPMHELPWDFWRYSIESWKSLFNKWTGFKIVRTENNVPLQIVLDVPNPNWQTKDMVGFVNSNLIARKISNYDQDQLRWDITAGDILSTIYPHS